MAKKMNHLRDLLEHEVQDLYSAEKQIIETLPEMAKAAKHKELKQAFRDHLKETRQQKKRLEKVAKILGVKPEGERCKGVEGLIKEGGSMMKKDGDKDVLDAGLIGAAQRVEHYEMAAYGTACQFAERLGLSEVKDILGETLQEEEAADDKLTSIATGVVNRAAAE